MDAQRTVTVFGATGFQGGGVARALLADKHFHVRAVTRDASSSKALMLATLGAELVQADLHDEASLQKAIAGSFGVFVVTDYWLSDIGDRETGLGVLLADISHKAGVQVFVYSSLPNVERLSNGKYACPHFSGKANAWESIKEIGLPCAATVEAPIYYQNMELAKFQSGPVLMGFSRNDDGTATLHSPVLGKDDKAPWFDVNEIGLPVLAILESPEKYNRKRLVFSNTLFDQPVAALLDTFTSVTGVPAQLQCMGHEDLAAYSKIFADVLTFIKQNGYFAGESDEVDVTEVTGPFSPFEAWLRQSSIPGKFN